MVSALVLAVVGLLAVLALLALAWDRSDAVEELDGLEWSQFDGFQHPPNPNGRRL